MNLDAISEIISQGLGGQPEEVLDAYENDYGGIEGQFFDRGLVYDYAIDDEGLTYQENRTDSEYIDAYFQGQVEAMGVRCDSDNTYEFYMGYMGVERNDAGRMNCQFGQCGGRCLGRGEECRLKDKLSAENTRINKSNNMMSKALELQKRAKEEALQAKKEKKEAWKNASRPERIARGAAKGADIGERIGYVLGGEVGGGFGVAGGGIAGGAVQGTAEAIGGTKNVIKKIMKKGARSVQGKRKKPISV